MGCVVPAIELENQFQMDLNGNCQTTVMTHG